MLASCGGNRRKTRLGCSGFGPRAVLAANEKGTFMPKEDDDLRPARGIILAVAIGIVIGLVIAVVWQWL